MKVYTIEVCGHCPEYIPNHLEYTADGKCRRYNDWQVYETSAPPYFCPLKEFENEPK